MKKKSINIANFIKTYSFIKFIKKHKLKLHNLCFYQNYSLMVCFHLGNRKPWDSRLIILNKSYDA